MQQLQPPTRRVNTLPKTFPRTESPGRSLHHAAPPSSPTDVMTTTTRQPLMETTDNTATSSPTPTSTARRSGRVTKAPAKFTPEPTSLSKRKRVSENDDGEDGENESPEEGPDEDDDPDASEVEQERQRSRKRKPSSQSAKAKKPALKKPKINGDAPSRPQTPAETPASAPALALNSHASLPSRPKKSARVAIAQPEGEGLYSQPPFQSEPQTVRWRIVFFPLLTRFNSRYF